MVIHRGGRKATLEVPTSTTCHPLARSSRAAFSPSPVIVLLLNTRTGTSLGVASFVVLGATVVVGATMFGCTGALVGAVVV